MGLLTKALLTKGETVKALSLLGLGVLTGLSSGYAIPDAAQKLDYDVTVSRHLSAEELAQDKIPIVDQQKLHEAQKEDAGFWTNIADYVLDSPSESKVAFSAIGGLMGGAISLKLAYDSIKKSRELDAQLNLKDKELERLRKSLQRCHFKQGKLDEKIVDNIEGLRKLRYELESKAFVINKLIDEDPSLANLAQRIEIEKKTFKDDEQAVLYLGERVIDFLDVFQQYLAGERVDLKKDREEVSKQKDKPKEKTVKKLVKRNSRLSRLLSFQITTGPTGSFIKQHRVKAKG